jgi:hypothetical protein
MRRSAGATTIAAKQRANARVAGAETRRAAAGGTCRDGRRGRRGRAVAATSSSLMKWERRLAVHVGVVAGPNRRRDVAGTRQRRGRRRYRATRRRRDKTATGTSPLRRRRYDDASGRGGGSRTRTTLRSRDFKSRAAAVSPLPRRSEGPARSPSESADWRRHPGSNRGMTDLQSVALPLGYAAPPRPRLVVVAVSPCGSGEARREGGTIGRTPRRIKKREAGAVEPARRCGVGAGAVRGGPRISHAFRREDARAPCWQGVPTVFAGGGAFAPLGTKTEARCR